MSFAFDPLSGEQNIAGFGMNTRGNYLYRDPFLDQATLAMPTDIKQLIKRCRFLFYNHSLISPVIRKAVEYYLTEIVLNHTPDLERTPKHREATKKAWEIIIGKKLKMRSFCAAAGFDLLAQGNCFVILSVIYPRTVKCSDCNGEYSLELMKQIPYSGVKKSFTGKCALCGEVADLEVRENKEATPQINLVRLNPLHMHIKHDVTSGMSMYEYTIPAETVKAIQSGDVDVIRTANVDFIKAALSTNKRVRFLPGKLFHMREVGLSDDTPGWGKPALTCVFRDVWHLAVLRRAEEATMLEHVNPMRILFPQPNASQDPSLTLDLEEWKRNIINDMYSHKADENYAVTSSIPVGVANIGGDARGLFITPEMDYLKLVVLNGLCIPREFYEGGTSYAGSQFSLKVLQNTFNYKRELSLDLVEWVIDQVSGVLGLDPMVPEFKPLKVQDDAQQLQILMGLLQQNRVSAEEVLEPLNLDYKTQVEKRMAELDLENQLNSKIAKAAAESSAETQKIMARTQVEIGYEQQKANEAYMAKQDDERLLQMQRRRRDYMKTLPPEQIPMFIQMGQASVSDVIDICQGMGMPDLDMFQYISNIKMGQTQVLQMFGIDPVTLNGLPDSLAIKIMNNVLSVSDLQGYLVGMQQQAMAAQGQQPGQGQPPGEGGGDQGQPPQQPPQAGPPQVPGSPQEAAVVNDATQGGAVDMTPMPTQRPPRRESMGGAGG